jgi:hypothetical protein
MGKDLKTFSAPVLRGGRFSDHSIPVDVLPEFVAYRDLVLGLAKHLFRERTSRQRVSRGFEQSFQLKLSAVDKDCAVPVLSTAAPETPIDAALEEDDLADFEAARDLIESALGSVAAGKGIPSDFPEQFVPALEDFGVTLQDDESIELRRPGVEKGVVYDHEVRERLRRRKAASYVKDATFEGSVVSWDWDGPTCRLRTFDGWTIGVKVPYGEAKDFLEALTNKRFLRIWITGNTRFAPGDVPRQVEEVIAHEIWSGTDEASVNRLEHSIDELKALMPGWLDGEHGESVSARCLDVAKHLFIDLMAENYVPRPRLYATAEGGIEAEWSFGTWEISATLSADGTSAWMHAANVQTLADDEETVSLEASNARERIEAFLKRFGAFGEGVSGDEVADE